MVPQAQRYKIDPARTDCFILAWYDIGDPVVEIVGWVSVDRFLAESREDGSFPIPTIHMDLDRLGLV